MNELCFDVGGTVLKYASCINGRISDIHTRPALSKAAGSVILDNFFSAFDELVNACDTVFDSIRFAFPGNFDYENGISLIRGVDKYENIYGMNLKTCFSEYMLSKHSARISEAFTCTFINDVHAVAEGCMVCDKRLKQGNVLVLCIGTGCGSAFCRNGKVITNEPDIPENGWVYALDFENKTFDDCLSLRGFRQLSKTILGAESDGLQVAERVKAGDGQALCVMHAFGTQIAKGLCMICKFFQPDYVVLGGGIINSYAYLAPPIQALADKLHFDVIPIPNISELAIRGLSAI